MFFSSNFALLTPLFLNCRLFETDPFSGSVKCLREKAGGSWKKERFIRKKAAVSNDDSSSEEESSDEEDDSSS